MPTNPLLVKASPVTYADFGHYLTFRESIKSHNALKNGISNIPTLEHYQNMARTYQHILVPLFNHFGKLPITSFYRSQALNSLTKKSSKTSAHLVGQAVDIDCDLIKGVTNKQVYEWAKKNLDFDQLINEFDYSWVHIGYRSKEKNRHMAFAT